MSEETIPCTGCGAPTAMLGTKLCDPCWHISIAGLDPRLARAADELLEALRLARPYVEEYDAWNSDEHLAFVDAALAKATGQ